mmetsp:Transcript_24902/g.58008  ORF Transcript_24902/g.58008 Transcript_24902/m.58008 type:complete len:109 (+) Transcript_24902:995-1321(+)
MQWQAKDLARRTRQAIRDANTRLKEKEHEEEDWSTWDAKQLAKTLQKHKVLSILDNDDEEEETMEMTKGMKELVKRYRLVVEDNEEDATSTTNTIESNNISLARQEEK